MPVDNLNHVPRVIKSDMTVEEINHTAQARLEARRKENERKERYLYGSSKEMKESTGSPISTLRTNMSPRYYKKHTFMTELH
jgi:hypothetical protein